MTYDEMARAIRDAKNTMELADLAANRSAELLEGRLRRVSCGRLARLKRELRDFNIHTGKWKEES